MNNNDKINYAPINFDVNKNLMWTPCHFENKIFVLFEKMFVCVQKRSYDRML